MRRRGTRTEPSTLVSPPTDSTHAKTSFLSSTKRFCFFVGGGSLVAAAPPCLSGSGAELFFFFISFDFFFSLACNKWAAGACHRQQEACLNHQVLALLWPKAI